MPATVTGYLPGDILFFSTQPADNQIVDKTIAVWTRSSFVHCAIAVSALLKVEALAGGVVKTPIDKTLVRGEYLYHKSAHVDATNLASALLWLEGQVGQVYGWGDIANAFLLKFEHGFAVDIGEHFDCSGLACEFLLKAGGVAALIPITNPHTVSPAALSALLGVTYGA